MDNDILINQARLLYAVLCVRQVLVSNDNQNRLERMSIVAYYRYQRRLNRCVLCYQYRANFCIRDPGEKSIPCSIRKTPKRGRVGLIHG